MYLLTCGRAMVQVNLYERTLRFVYDYRTIRAFRCKCELVIDVRGRVRQGGVVLDCIRAIAWSLFKGRAGAAR